MNSLPSRKKSSSVRISVMDYDGQSLREHDVKAVEECIPYKDKPSVTWINVEGTDCPEVLEKLNEVYCVHHLMIEDITPSGQRPRMLEHGGYIFFLARMLSYNAGEGRLKEEQVSFILGPNFVITFQEGAQGDVFEPVRQRLRGAGTRLRSSGADYLLYALLDSLLDSCFRVLDVIADSLQDIDELIFKKTDASMLRKMRHLKNDLLVVRRLVWPLRDAVHALVHSDSVLIREATAVYLDDLHNHVIQAVDTVEVLRDNASGMMGIYLSSVSYRTNEVMKVLTIIATIFMPLTFIAGVYGMNFSPSASRFNMPELLWPFGYFWALGLMLLVSAGMIVYFRRKKWL